jgi:autotransporter-associated beta strand protein
VNLEFNGAVGGGAFAFTQGSGGGTTTFSGPAANTFTGLTRMNVGLLQLNKTAGVNAVAGDLSVFTGGAVRWLASNQVANTSTLTINGSSSSADLNDQTDTIAGLAMTGGTLALGAGSLTMAGGITANNSVATANITGGGMITASALDVQGNLTRSGGGVTRLTGATLTIAAGKQLNLTNTKLISAAPLANVKALIVAGRNGGTWDGGAGMITSMSDAGPASQLTTLAVANAGAIGKTSFGGVNVLTTDTLVMYTYIGDATLDGLINGDDFAAIDAGYSAQLTNYSNGDFNFSGGINADDYWLIDRNYSRNLPQLLAAPVVGMAAVPEPCGFGAVAMALALFGGGRRRRRCASAQS